MLTRRALVRTVFSLCVGLASLAFLSLFAFSTPLYAQQSSVTLNPGESVTIEGVNCNLSGYPSGPSSETVLCGNGTPPAALGSQQGYVYLAPTNSVTVQGNNCTLDISFQPNHDWVITCGSALPAAPTNTPVPAGPTCVPLDFDALPAGRILTQEGDVTFTVQQGVAGKVILYPTNNSNWPETDLDVENVGNVLVFPEVVTLNNKGLAKPVGDNADGGKLIDYVWPRPPHSNPHFRR